MAHGRSYETTSDEFKLRALEQGGWSRDPLGADVQRADESLTVSPRVTRHANFCDCITQSCTRCEHTSQVPPIASAHTQFCHHSILQARLQNWVHVWM